MRVDSKDWKGNNSFYCGGKLISGPSREFLPAFVCLVTLIAIALLWGFFGLHLLAKEGTFAWFCAYLTEIAALLCICLHLVCTYSDPGVIPRETTPSSQEIECQDTSQIYQKTHIYQ